MATPVRGQIVVYADANFQGAFRVIFNDCPTLVPDGFNDKISSFVIVSGDWRFYQDVNYGGQYAPVLGPGAYPWVVEVGIPNDQISSLRC